MGFDIRGAGPPGDLHFEQLGRKYFRQAVPLTFVANCLVAVLLRVTTRDSWGETLVYAHAIGFSILLYHFVGHRLIRGTRCPEWVVTVVALPLGSGTGLFLSWWILTGTVRGHLGSLPFSAASTLVIGGAVTYYFYTRARLAIADAQRQAHELRSEEAARQLAEAELKLLQAQIEPHFLFNTLSNVVSLIEGDPPRAKRMLLNLTSYLRASLRRTRAGAVTLGEELQLVRAYLEIQAVRMGPRLAFRLECPDDLRELPLPPLLLQPLVENALKHGLEPRTQGGTVAVTAAREGAELALEVRDDGLGLDPHHRPGVGLTNVRRRIEAVSGGRGSLSLRPLPEGGLCARICLPLPGPGAASPAAAAPASAAPGPVPLAGKASP